MVLKPDLAARLLRDADWQAAHGNPAGALKLYRRLFASGHDARDAFERYRRLHIAVHAADVPHGEIFDFIYRSNFWGEGNGAAGNASGLGSTLESTAPYRAFLASFLRERNVRSVLDIGCGDWELSRLIDWSGVDYTGFDVSAVVLENTRQHAREGVRFIEGDARTAELPRADLVLMKDVLQHWPNDDIKKFLPRLEAYRYTLLTNGAARHSSPDVNRDIHAGSYRFIDLTLPPFGATGTFVFSYDSAATLQDGSMRSEYKRVLLVEGAGE